MKCLAGDEMSSQSGEGKSNSPFFTEEKISASVSLTRSKRQKEKKGEEKGGGGER